MKAEQLFVVSNCYMLEQGIHNVCQTDVDPDKQSKAGLKVAIGSLIRVAAKSVIANFIITNRINNSNQVYLINEIDEAIKHPGPLTKVMYVHLRKVTVTRLTILNARRGTELARMQLKDFNERHAWISQGMSKELTAKYAITFIMGKGNTLVPVLLPRECEKAMVMLDDGANRAHAGISPKNDFLFAYTQ